MYANWINLVLLTVIVGFSLLMFSFVSPPEVTQAEYKKFYQQYCVVRDGNKTINFSRSQCNLKKNAMRSLVVTEIKENYLKKM